MSRQLSNKVSQLREQRLSRILIDNNTIPYYDEMFVVSINNQLHTITKQEEEYKITSITDPMDLFMYQYGKYYKCLDETTGKLINFPSEKEAISYTKLKSFW